MDFLLYTKRIQFISIKLIQKKNLKIYSNNSTSTFFNTMNKQGCKKQPYLLVLFLCLKILPRAPPFFEFIRRKEEKIYEKRL